MILLLDSFWKNLGLKNIELQINNIGDPDERLVYKKKLIDYFSSKKELLDQDSLNRLESNPLRILDSKNPELKSVIDGAPKFIDEESLRSADHFNQVCKLLDQQNIKYKINKNLVRGLDYYNRTVFEFVTHDLGSQGTIAGGGRYDYLIESINGQHTPAIGVGIGIERVILLLEQQNLASDHSVDFYLLSLGDNLDSYAFDIASIVRKKGYSILMNIGNTSFKSQMKKADKSGAQVAIIVGEDEFNKNSLQVKLLRNEGSQQELQFKDFEKFITNNETLIRS